MSTRVLYKDNTILSMKTQTFKDFVCGGKVWVRPFRAVQIARKCVPVFWPMWKVFGDKYEKFVEEHNKNNTGHLGVGRVSNQNGETVGCSETKPKD